jgi:hypothetical protein
VTVAPIVSPGSGADTHLVELAEALRPLAQQANEDDGRPALAELVAIATSRVPSATCGSLTLLRGPRFSTEAATDEVARRADGLQHDLGDGPCVDAAVADSVYGTGDVSPDGRWPRWGRQVRAELGVVSVLSQRFTLLDESGAVASLNLYSDSPDAFGPKAVGMGLVLCSHGSLLLTAILARGRATNLVLALESNREIGVAMGILMQRHQVSREVAFDLLRSASQDTNRKLSAVASEVADTGMLAAGRRPLGLPRTVSAV